MRILNTKFNLPMGDEKTRVLRRDLLRKMENALATQLVLVSAPAGFGKSSFLSQWIDVADLKERTAWVSLEEDENDSMLFWGYVMTAIDRVVPGVCHASLLQLQAASGTGVGHALVTMINRLEQLTSHLILVLDDFHLITSPEIHEGIIFLLDHPISQLTLVISGRTRPPFSLSRYRVSGRLMELSDGDLRFSVREISEYMCRFTRSDSGPKNEPTKRGRVKNEGVNLNEGNESNGGDEEEEKDNESNEAHDIDGGTAEMLHQKTEGWIAALKLAMISYKDKQAFTIERLSGDDAVIRDYLMDEVFSGLPETVQRFLIKISILDRFTVSLCEAVTEDNAARSHIHFIAAQHLFIIPLDRSAAWFRFHHLFHDFLKRLLDDEPRSMVRLLHERGFCWLDDHGCFEEAFSHALKAHRRDLAAAAFAKRVHTLYDQQGERSLDALFEKLDKADIFNETVLICYYLSLKTYRLEFEALDEMARVCRQKRTVSKADRQLLEGFHFALQAYYFFYREGNLELSLNRSKQAVTLIPDEHGSIHRILEFMMTICLRFMGEIEPALALARPKASDNLLSSALRVMNRSSLEMELGELIRANDLLSKEIATVERIFGTAIPPMYGFLYVNYGMLLKEWYRLDEANKAFEKGISVINQTGFIELIVISYGEYAMLLAALGDFDGAHGAIDHAFRLIRENRSSLLTAYFNPYKYRIWLKEKKMDLVTPLAKEYTITEELDIPFIRSREYLLLARYYIEVECPEKALTILDIMIEEDEALQRHHRLIEVFVLRAKSLWLKNRPAEALRALERSFELSRNQGHVHIYVDELQGWDGLVGASFDNRSLPDILVPHFNPLHGGDRPSLNLKENRSVQGKSPERMTWSDQGKPSHRVKSDSPRVMPQTVRINDFEESFNAREIQILTQFQKGASNKEAAEALCLSVNTVRWYAGNIFSKLGVKRRGQAVSKALELGML